MKIIHKVIKLPVTMSTDAMDTEEGDANTKKILDKTQIKARWVQRRSRLIKGLNMEPGDALRPLSVPLPKSENEKGWWDDQLLLCHPLFSQTMRKLMMNL